MTNERLPQTLFVTRHPGALDWARGRGIAFDRVLSHLNIGDIGAGDRVIGTLPVHLAAAVCARGGQYVHLSLSLPAAARGRELTGHELAALDARLEGYEILRKDTQ